MIPIYDELYTIYRTIRSLQGYSMLRRNQEDVDKIIWKSAGRSFDDGATPISSRL